MQNKENGKTNNKCIICNKSVAGKHVPYDKRTTVILHRTDKNGINVIDYAHRKCMRELYNEYNERG